MSKLSNPFSTSGGGHLFEAHVQASFVVLMLTGGHAPCLPCWPIKKVKLQGKVDGFDTDDLIVFVERSDTKEQRKLLGQVKHSIQITEGNTIFYDVIQSAWSDFNKDNFRQEKDKIALITGPLNKTDPDNVYWLLNHARKIDNPDEFFRHIKTARFSPADSDKKLDLIRKHVKKANGDIDVSDEKFHSFLRHFHLLGYDLGEEIGVVLSLLYSHISQINQQYPPEFVWPKVVETVQIWNKHAGAITPENLPEDLREAFKRPVVVYIPQELTRPHFDIAKTDWQQHKYAADLALLLLVGAWNEKNEADVSIVTKLTGQEYAVLAPRIQELLHLTDSSFTLHNRIWKISERVGLWEQLGSRIFDQHLDTFKECAVSVLTERDPAFELSKDQRFAANIYGKTPKYSPALKKGLAEGLALLGSHPKMLNNCSQGKPEATAALAVRAILADADWVLWGSLGVLLPVLAEAAPREFLDAVKNALQASPCPFDELFAQEGSGVMDGNNYLVGLLCALEALAWDADYLIQVCVLLGELASRDPGGTWNNRPGNSLSTILLPWKPHTIAPLERRKAAIKTLCNELPQIGWQLVVGLLPNQHQMTFGSYKPSWRNTIPDNWKEGVTNGEYWEQVSFYAELAVSLAGHDLNRLSKLSDIIDSLPEPSFGNFLKVLSSDALTGISEENRLNIWNKLSRFIFKNRRYPQAEWAWSDEQLAPVQVVADKLAPANPFNSYQRLFIDDDFDFYDQDDSSEIKEQKITERREQALKEILLHGGINLIIKFAKTVVYSNKVGNILGRIGDETTDAALLPACLEQECSDLSFFIRWYVFSRYSVQGWVWVDNIDKSDWSNSQTGFFLSCLPFTKETWSRAENWLGGAQKEYWLKTDAKIYNEDDKDLSFAVDKLLEYERSYTALDCLHQMWQYKQKIDIELCVRVLLAAVSGSIEPSNIFDPHHASEFIKMMQESSKSNPDDLFKLEWAYLPLLDGLCGIVPKTLEKHLASEPEFFSHIIQLIYRSKNSDAAENPSEKEKNIAENAWKLLRNWRVPPGMQEEGRFNEDQFSDWLKRVKELCAESGHLEVAFEWIGRVLVCCPSDASGLWINKAVAAALNEKDAEEMRDGFRSGLFYSRGFYMVDPTGKPERELAEKYRQQADAVENEGYHRLAATLRELAKSYESDAERVIAEYAQEQKNY
uniref:hypothetical protein n=1 Tax=Candidatus Electronema sp. TaxID=2698783 RepID=UPI0040561AAE